MQISKSEIEHVAKLARLNLTEQEKDKLTQQMGDLIGFVDKLNELNTDGVEPTVHALPMQNKFREDVVEPSFDREKILQNAPSKRDGCFSVPKVVE